MRIGFIARPVEDDFEFAALKEVPCLEFHFSSDLSALRRSAEIRGWKQKYETDISTVALFGRNYLAADEAERREHFAALRQVTDFAKAVGSPLVTTGGGLNPTHSREQSCERAAELFAEPIRYAESLGLKFAFYNCPWANFITGPEAWEPLLGQAFPTAGIKFDPSHPLHTGQDWSRQLADWGHRVYHAHAKDTLFIDGKPFEDVPAGLGEIPWGRFFALLYHHRYRGDINVEINGRTWSEGQMHYSGILLARHHLQQFIAPSGLATPSDFPI